MSRARGALGRLWTLALLLAGLAALPAQAHKPSDSYLSLEAGTGGGGEPLRGRWDIALRDLDYAIGLDADGDGRLTWGEVRRRHADIAAYALARLSVEADGAACPVTAGPQQIDEHTDGAYTVIELRIACPAPPKQLLLRYQLFADLDPQHRGLLKLTSSAGTRSAILGPQAPEQRFELKQRGRLAQFLAYTRDGVHHIAIGYDHILFLLSLLLPAVLWRRSGGWQAAGRFRDAFIDVAKIVTAFTVAHSITLTLATLGWVTLPSRLVESAIAASVVLAALNNLFPLVGGRRWLAAFGFGLIHGFGFAGVLVDLGLPQQSLLTALLGFNVGVELGQLAIVGVFLPVAYALRHTAFYRKGVLVGGSVAIALIASVWLAERLFDIELLKF